MKKNYAGLKSLWGTACMLMCLMVGDGVWGQFTIATDNAVNYSGNWTGNQGTGFNSWSLTANAAGGFAGRFIGNPSTAGINGMNSSSFGLFANPNNIGNESKAFRSFSGGALQFGDTFSFQMGMNFDANNGDGFKGIDLRSSSSVVLNFNMANSSTITWGRPGAGSGGNLFTAYGTQAMNFQITKVGVNQYRIVATPRTGSTNFDETHTLAGEISAFEFYAGRLDAGDQRQPYYNNLTITNSGVFNVSSGTETYSRSLSGSGNLSKSGNGTLVLSGNNTYTGTTLVTGGTLQLNAASGNTLGNSAVTINGGTLLVSTNQTLANLTLTTGGLTVDSGATLTLSGNVTIPNGFTITNNGTLIVEGALTDNRGTKTFGGIVRYAASSGSQSLVGATYNNLELNGNSTKNLSASATINGNLSINAGTLNLGEFTMNRASSGGTLTLAANTTLTIGGSNSFPTNYAAHSVAATSTVNYSGTNQVVSLLNSSQSYGNLILSGTGNITFGGDVVAENLTNEANATTLVASGQNLRVKSVLTNTGGFVIENNANLIQEGSTNNNTGDITIFRESSPLWRLDYTLWSSPVVGQNLLAFSPLTVPNRFYIYNPSTNLYNTITPSTNDFQPGEGYLIRMPDNHISNINNNPAQIWGGEFMGPPNNGDVTVTVANDSFNAVGNPYSSTINAASFYAANNLTEPLYFWRKINGAAGSAYATWTTAGGASSGSDSTEPNGIIQVGQGFILKSTSSSVVFNNSMRVGNNANQFLRTAEVEHNRVRVAMTGPNNFSQNILVNYMSGATNEFDPAIDGKYINDSETAFYTLLNDEAYVIQGRALPFDSNDIVPLGFKTIQAGSYQISLVSVDGLFSDNQTVYLEDFVAGLTHDFANGTYTFGSEIGVHHNRFQLKYINQPLNIEQPTSNFLTYWLSERILYLQNSNDELSEVTLYDITGRMVKSFQQIDANQFNISLQEFSKQVLMVQVKCKSGLMITKKIIN